MIASSIHHFVRSIAGLTTIVTIGLFLMLSFAAAQPAPERDGEHILLSAVTYCCEQGGNHPWLLCVRPGVGGMSRSFYASLARLQIQPVGRSWILRDVRPNHFFYVEVDSVKMLSPTRAEVVVYLARDMDPPIIAEAYGKLVLNKRHKHWIIDGSKTTIESGD